MKNREDAYIERRLSELHQNSDGCCLYPVSGDCYAKVHSGALGPVYLHIYVLEKKLGRRLLPGMKSLHTCDIKNCVSADHLYEGTQEQNVHDMLNRGRTNNRKGAAHHRSKLNDKKVALVRKLYELGYTQTNISSVILVSQGTISLVVRGERW